MSQTKIYKLDVASGVDYEKLLRRCMSSWFDAEGRAWNGENDPVLTEEEKIVANRIYEECRENYQNSISPSSLMHNSETTEQITNEQVDSFLDNLDNLENRQ